MTEIALPDTTEQNALMAWAEGARAAHQIAVSLAKTPFVPQQMQGKPELVTAAILAGYEMGMQPLASLRSIDLIQGTPAMRAHTLRALVQAQGHDVWLDEATNTRAIVCGRRKGSDQVQRSVWTMDRAKALGLSGKDNWRKQPQAMLVARATAEVCRLVASDAILGIPYAVEELGDDEPEATPKRAKRTAQRKPVETAPELPEPTVEPETKPEVEGKVVEDGQEWPEPPADWTPDE